jgi:uncharacterized protein YuzE
MNLTDYAGNNIRLTDERLAHIKEHPEMFMHADKINETLINPDAVVKSRSDGEANLYYKRYWGLPIGDKYLCSVVKFKTRRRFCYNSIFYRQHQKRRCAMEKVKVWYDPEGDYLEVMFEKKEGYFKETESDQIMEKVDMDGNVIGFSILKVSSLKDHPIEVALAGAK